MRGWIVSPRRAPRGDLRRRIDDSYRAPLVLGGQGRDAEDIEADGRYLGCLLAVVFALACWALVWWWLA